MASLAWIAALVGCAGLAGAQAPQGPTDQFYVAPKISVSDIGPGGGFCVTAAHDWLLAGLSVDVSEELDPIGTSYDPLESTELLQLQLGYGANGRTVSKQILLGWMAATFVRRGPFQGRTGGEGCESGMLCGTTEHYVKRTSKTSGASLAGRLVWHGARVGIGIEGAAGITSTEDFLQGSVIFVWGLLRAPRPEPLKFF
ncbi:MAG: hypothetical protein IPN71_07810 [Fibrobacteres bacterium]|jgi:hypothetical protein|nr:hypothetical protein [Fibrobacterota bacterium]